MKKWKILLGLGIGYFTYLLGGAIYADHHVREYRNLAHQKADTDGNGVLNADEVLAVYEKLGFSGEEIFERVSGVKSLHTLIMKSKKEYSALEGILDSIFELREDTIGNIKSYTLRKGDQIIHQTLKEIARLTVDKNSNRIIDLQEAQEAFRLVHSGDRQEAYLGLSYFVGKGFGGAMFQQLMFMIYSPYVVNNSELARFVKNP